MAARNVKPKTQPTCSKSAFANVSVGVVLNKKKIQGICECDKFFTSAYSNKKLCYVMSRYQYLNSF